MGNSAPHSSHWSKIFILNACPTIGGKQSEICMPTLAQIQSMKPRHLRRDMTPMQVKYRMGYTNKAFLSLDVKFGDLENNQTLTKGDAINTSKELSELEFDPGCVSKIENLQRLYQQKGKTMLGYYSVSFLDSQGEVLGKIESHPFENHLDQQYGEEFYEKREIVKAEDLLESERIIAAKVKYDCEGCPFQI